MNTKKLKKVLLSVAIMSLAVAGVKLQATGIGSTDLTLANLNALQGNKDLECPSIYDRPYSSMKHELKKYENVVCVIEGSLSLDKSSFSGDFSKGSIYHVVIDFATCKDDNNRIVCCKTEEQGAKVVSVIEIEQ